ncbi:hypothetical protein KJ966_12145 [bacterium]|nr:hypothetical protein [bacterium]
MIYKNIVISQIDFDDHLFFLANQHAGIHWDQDSQVFNPVWLQEISPEKFRIIDGFIIANAIREFNHNISVPALIFNKDASLVEIWQKRGLKRLNEQNLSVLAFLEGLINILEYLNIETVPSEFLILTQELGITEKHIKLIPLKKDLNKIKQNCSFADLYSLNYKDITDLSSRKKEDLQSLSCLFGELNIKGNKLNSIIQMVDDLSKGYNLSIKDLLNNAEITAILEATPLHQRYKQLKIILSSLRWPTLTALKKDWAITIKKLKLPKQITITIDPFFEADEIEFKFNASSAGEYKMLLDNLREKAESQEIHHLFKLI